MIRLIKLTTVIICILIYATACLPPGRISIVDPEPDATTSSKYATNPAETTVTEEARVFDEIENTLPATYTSSDLNSIYIDGYIIPISTRYNRLVATFGNQLKMKNPEAGEIEDAQIIDVDPTYTSMEIIIVIESSNGDGSAYFTFKSNMRTTIDDMYCYQIELRGGNKEVSSESTIALPNDITFGSTYDDIIDAYGTPVDKDVNIEGYDKGFRVVYRNDNGIKFIFSSDNKGLEFVRIGGYP